MHTKRNTLSFLLRNNISSGITLLWKYFLPEEDPEDPEENYIVF